MTTLVKMGSVKTGEAAWKAEVMRVKGLQREWRQYNDHTNPYLGCYGNAAEQKRLGSMEFFYRPRKSVFDYTTCLVQEGTAGSESDINQRLLVRFNSQELQCLQRNNTERHLHDLA